MEYEFKAGWCPSCNQGWVVFVKESLSNSMLLLCEECFTNWASPTDYSFDLPYLNDPMSDDWRALPVTRNEIIDKGWERFIINPDKDEIPFLKSRQ